MDCSVTGGDAEGGLCGFWLGTAWAFCEMLQISGVDRQQLSLLKILRADISTGRKKWCTLDMKEQNLCSTIASRGTCVPYWCSFLDWNPWQNLCRGGGWRLTPGVGWCFQWKWQTGVCQNSSGCIYNVDSPLHWMLRFLQLGRGNGFLQVKQSGFPESIFDLVFECTVWSMVGRWALDVYNWNIFVIWGVIHVFSICKAFKGNILKQLH